MISDKEFDILHDLMRGKSDESTELGAPNSGLWIASVGKILNPDHKTLKKVRVA